MIADELFAALSGPFYDDFAATTARRVREHPLPQWVERMTCCHLAAHGGAAVRGPHGWRLLWPDGELYENIGEAVNIMRVRLNINGFFIKGHLFGK